MQRRFSIRKFLTVVAWFAVISGITILLIAANSSRNDHVCRKVVISIKGAEEKFYLDKKDIEAFLKKENNEGLVNRLIGSISLEQLEKQLERNAWIAGAELYFDSRDVLHVNVTERNPVARVFTAAGTSFYMDAAGHRMPLLPKVSIRLPVVTNFPAAAKLKTKDSILLKDVKEIVTFVSNHPFWQSQIAQIDIASGRNFELVPTLGSHIIRLGTTENLEQKFRSLYVFYRQVISRTGFDKYAALDVQYRSQVVAVYKGAVSVVDSVKLQRNIEELIRRGRMQEQYREENAEQVLMNSNTAFAKSSYINDSVATAIKKTNMERRPAPKIPIPTKSNRFPMPEKKRDVKNEMKKKDEGKNEKRKAEGKRPKAIMPGSSKKVSNGH